MPATQNRRMGHPIRASFPVCPVSYATSSIPLLTRNTCPSGCRTCISRTFHGISAGGNVTSSPAARHCLWTSSTSLTHTDIQAPLSAVWSPPGPNVEAFAPLPRPPWPPTQRKISHSPDPTAPKVGGVPQSQHFLQPHFSNHAKLAEMSDTFSIGVTCFAFMPPKDSTAIKAAPEKARPRGSPCAGGEECLTLGFRGRYSLLHFLFHASGFFIRPILATNLKSDRRRLPHRAETSKKKEESKAPGAKPAPGRHPIRRRNWNRQPNLISNESAPLLCYEGF